MEKKCLIRDVIAKGLEETDEGVLPITLPYYSMNMAAFLLTLLIFDDPELFNNDEVAAIRKCIGILTQNDLLRGTRMLIDVHSFLSFLLKEEFQDEKDLGEAFSAGWIIDKWNDFAKQT